MRSSISALISFKILSLLLFNVVLPVEEQDKLGDREVVAVRVVTLVTLSVVVDGWIVLFTVGLVMVGVLAVDNYIEIVVNRIQKEQQTFQYTKSIQHLSLSEIH